jgi:hypothetical protein
MLDRVEAVWFMPDKVEVLGEMIMIIARLLYRGNAGWRLTVKLNSLDKLQSLCTV